MRLHTDFFIYVLFPPNSPIHYPNLSITITLIHIKNEYKEGDYFGERALIKGEPRYANIVAKSELVKVISLDRDSFKRLLEPIEEILKRNMDKYQTFIVRGEQQNGEEKKEEEHKEEESKKLEELKDKIEDEDKKEEGEDKKEEVKTEEPKGEEEKKRDEEDKKDEEEENIQRNQLKNNIYTHTNVLFNLNSYYSIINRL